MTSVGNFRITALQKQRCHRLSRTRSTLISRGDHLSGQRKCEIRGLSVLKNIKYVGMQHEHGFKSRKKLKNCQCFGFLPQETTMVHRSIATVEL